MPRNFKHAWRSPDEQERRDVELSSFLAYQWEEPSLETLLGHVPATMLNLAKQGALCPALNLDGEHVDLDICQRAIEYAGAENLIGMTDNIEMMSMAGEALHLRPGTSLRHRDDGAVAAGGLGLESQIDNARSIGLTRQEIDFLFYSNPREAASS
jgi:N-acetylglucosamine-6-phosphate deacetylase